MLLVGVIRAYQLVLSPLLPPTCRFQPTCSAYALQAVKRYGALRGGLLAAWRILRCNPWGGSGYDPPRWPGDSRERESYRRVSAASSAQGPHSQRHAALSSVKSSSSYG